MPSSAKSSKIKKIPKIEFKKYNSLLKVVRIRDEIFDVIDKERPTVGESLHATCMLVESLIQSSWNSDNRFQSHELVREIEREILSTISSTVFDLERKSEND